MSETEIRKGKLAPFYDGNSLEGDCQAACVLRGVTELAVDYDTWEEMLMEHFYKDFEVINGQLYVYKENIEVDPYGFADVKKNDDGSIDFFCMWYNGGGTLGEVIADALKRA